MATATADRPTSRYTCWGCNAPAPSNRAPGLTAAGWHTRRTTATAPGHNGFKPVTYELTEFACPACFAATGGWYDVPTIARGAHG
jgi:hypothetical protein